MLFKTTDDLKKVLPFTANFDFNDIASFIENAEKDEIVPFIGQDQYDELNIAYASADNDDNLFPALKKLLGYVRRPALNAGFLNMIPFRNVNIGKSGFSVTETQSEKIAGQFRIEDLKAQCISEYYKGMESLLLFLESNRTDYPEWTGSDAFSLALGSLINTAVDFNSYVNINNSRMVFIKVKPVMSQKESIVAKVTGQALFDQLKDQVKNRNLSPENNRIIGFARLAVATATIAEAILLNTLTWTSYGIQAISSSNSLTQVNESTAPNERLNRMIEVLNKQSQTALSDLSDYLFKNHEDYPLYEADSSVYADPSTSQLNTDQTNSTHIL